MREISLEERKIMKEKFMQLVEPPKNASLVKSITSIAAYNERLKDILKEHGLDEPDDFDYSTV